VVKATCPVRGALGGNPLLRGSMDAVLRLHFLKSLNNVPFSRHFKRSSNKWDCMAYEISHSRHSAQLSNAPSSTLLNTIWVTVWLLDSLCEAGYFFERE
jgi:hypothetical protein